MRPTQKDLIDTDGENRAVRAFLLGREVGCKDYEQMRRHMTNSGFNDCWPSEFASLSGHMSKADQQIWLRHLFALERFGAGGGEPVAWEWRWFDTSPYTVTSGQWSEWKRVKPRNALCTLDDALNEFRAYIANGHRYELRALYTHPPPHRPACRVRAWAGGCEESMRVLGQPTFFCFWRMHTR